MAVERQEYYFVITKWLLLSSFELENREDPGLQ
jgi:hypothetical protein